MTRMPSLTGFGAAVVLCVSVASSAAAQAPDAQERQISRAELEARLEQYEQASTSGGYSARLRDQARREAELIRRRLDEGDFRVGDRIVLNVRGEPQMPDTLVVGPGQVVTIPRIGEVPLEGVLRSEIEDHMRRELSRFIRDPVVQARSLVRISIMGEVGRPGFFVLPASMLFEEALMAAGGPSRKADLEKIEIQRSQRIVWEGPAVHEAIVEGRTLDQLSLRGGDRIEVPTRPTPIFGNGVIRTIIFAIPTTLLLWRRLRL